MSNRQEYFPYGTEEIDHLSKADPLLGAAIRRLGPLQREIMPDLFTALVHAIVGQLISAKAAVTIWGRMLGKFGAITPQNLASRSVEDIQTCGLTMKKSACIHAIADSVAKEELNLEQLSDLQDAEFIRTLTSLNGIGQWTAEMLLIHALKRPDVVSWGDIAIRRGMMMLYGLENLTKPQFHDYRSRYSPYGTVASIYLWELAAAKEQ